VGITAPGAAGDGRQLADVAVQLLWPPQALDHCPMEMETNSRIYKRESVMKIAVILIVSAVVLAASAWAQIPEPPVGVGTYVPNTPQQPTGVLESSTTLPGEVSGLPGTPIPDVAPLPPRTSANRTGTSSKTARSSGIPLPPTAAASIGTTRGTGGWGSGQAALSGGPFPAYMTGYGAGQTAAGFGGGTSVPLEKPFGDYSPAPSVSPYINLYRPEGAFGAAGNYYSLVRPMVQQQQLNRQLSRRLNQMQSALSTGPRSVGRTGAAGGYFMNYYGFYPGLGSR